MGRLCQLVLLASIVASCISYSIVSSKHIPVPEPPLEPSESDFSNFPTVFMKKLIASLSPEQLKELQTPIKLGSKLSHRTGIEGETPCRKRHVKHTFYTETAKDDKEEYYIIPLQSITYFTCNTSTADGAVYDNKCGPTTNPNGLPIAYCCHQHKATIPLKVIPYPTSTFYICNETLCFKDTKVEYVSSADIWKEIYVKVNSDCICDEYEPESLLLLTDDDHYSCPKPDSRARKLPFD